MVVGESERKERSVSAYFRAQGIVFSDISLDGENHLQAGKFIHGYQKSHLK
jgi:hypothetical protein